MAKKRRNYDDKFRASAVTMLEAAGYPDRKGALAEVAKACKVQERTLSRWFNGEQNPPPDQMVSEKRADLKEMLRAEIDAALLAMPGARADASYRDMGTVAAILIDKLQLLENKPTERIEHIESLTPEQRTNRIVELLESARARRDGRAADRVQ